MPKLQVTFFVIEHNREYLQYRPFLQTSYFLNPMIGN